MNFLNIVYNSSFLLEEENLYKISASLNLAANKKKLKIIILRNLSKEEVDKIKNAENNRANKSDYFYATKLDPSSASSIDKNLYIFKYIKSKKEEEPNAAVIYVTNSEYSKIINELEEKKIPKDWYTINEISIDELINIFSGNIELSADLTPKGAKIRTRYVQTNNIKSLDSSQIDSVINGMSISAAREKNKEKKLSVKPKEEEELETGNEYTKEEREKAMKYLSSRSSQVDPALYSIDLYKIYDLIEEIKLNNVILKTASSKEEEKEEAKKIKKQSIEELVSIINNYDAEERIKDAIFYVYIHSKFDKTPELQKQIETIYKKEVPSSDNISKSITSKEKENIPTKSKQKKVKDNNNKESTYYIYSLDNSGKYVTNTTTLTLDQLKKTEESVEKNKKKFLEDMEEYEKAKKEWDKYERDIELYKQLKKGAEPKEPSIPIPTPLLPSKYGILKIEKKGSSSKKVNELSATGGGAAPGTGASVTPGSGEGVATKYAFAKKPKIVRKKFEFKNEAKMIFWETIRGLLKNR